MARAPVTNPGEILGRLPAAVFVMEDGRVGAGNEAGAALAAGRSGTTLAGLLDLTRRDGAPVDVCPMRRGLEEGRELAGARLNAQGPGGRVDVLVSVRVLRDAEGRAGDVVAVVVEDSGGVSSAEPIDGARLAAIVASSSDAIISKTLDGRITSWNGSATRIFGYTAEEMIGESVLRIIPPELHGEEAAIIDRLRRGERIEHFDTVRVGRGGRTIDVSLTISPLRNAAGQVVGASKIARDITQRKRAETLQAQLFDELTHRVNNTLGTLQSIAALSLLSATDPASFVARFSGRLRALGLAHDLIVRSKMQGADLRQLVQEVVAGNPRLSGPDVVLDRRLVVPLALALDDLAATRGPDGHLAIEWQVRGDAVLELDWRERRDAAGDLVQRLGAGLAVIERVLDGTDGSIRVGQREECLEVRLTLPLPRDDHRPVAGRDAPAAAKPSGRRVLVVEDEALIAMDMEVQLTAAGWDVVGPAGTIGEALALIGSTTVDAALVDANVRGRPVGEVAEALRARGVPFAFATGYGRSALPAGFRDERLLAKPFAPDDLIAAVAEMLGRADAPVSRPERP